MRYDLESLRAISPRGLAALGTPDVAYMRPVATPDGRMAVGIFAADGNPLGVVATRDRALAVLADLDLEPVSLQ